MIVSGGSQSTGLVAIGGPAVKRTAAGCVWSSAIEGYRGRDWRGGGIWMAPVVSGDSQSTRSWRWKDWKMGELLFGCQRQLTIKLRE